MSTITAEAAGTQRGRADDADGTHGPDSIAHIHNVFVPGERRLAADDSRADRLFIDSCRRMSEASLREVVASMHRHDGPIYEWCREQAAGILAERFGVTPDEDGDGWDRERAAQAAWAEGQAEGARAETDG